MSSNLLNLLPSINIIFGAFFLLLVSNSKRFSTNKLNLISVFFLSVSFLLEYQSLGRINQGFLLENILHKNFILDDFAILFDLMFTAGAILTLLINNNYFKDRKYFRGEYFALILFSVFGMMMLSHSYELITAFISLEIASFSVYALVGYHRSVKIKSEAMMKYMVLGAMTSAFFILGIVLIYGDVGSTSMLEISRYVTANNIEDMKLLILGGTFIMITFLFKIGAVPFHAWIIDVYQGATYPITMFIASTFKIAVFAILLRLFLVDFVNINIFWIPMLQTITILTLIGGSFLAISQNNIKRMLAGSSIVHSGYMLIAISSIGLGSELATSAIIFYLIAYFISSAGAFGILSFISTTRRGQMTYENFKGFARRNPFIALMMSVFMLSLAGFPSTIGFLGKFYIFTSAIESDQILLAGIGIFTAFISVYYYFKLVAMMYFYQFNEKQKNFSISISTSLLAILAVTVIWGGIGTSLIPGIPGADSIIDLAKQAANSLNTNF